MDIKIIVAAHKKYWMKEDPVYLPLHVGAEGKVPLDYTLDNTGDNISAKNPNYCELTGLYWAWKNLKNDYIGLCHYRRYFGYKAAPIATMEEKKQLIFRKEDYENILKDYDVILPEKTFLGIRSSIKKQYAVNHYWKDMCIARQVIEEKYPEYAATFDIVMKKHSGYYLNMLVTRKEIFDAYCDWIFSILFEVEKRVDISGYDALQSRIFGLISERLFNVWLWNQKLKVKEVPVVFLEQHESVSLKRRIRMWISRNTCRLLDLY